MLERRVPPRSAWALVAILTACGGWQCDEAEGDERAPPRRGAVTFAEVTTASGLGDFLHVTGSVGKRWMPETVGGGGAFLDYDGDGWLDILLIRGAGWAEEGASPMNALVLYRNMGDGTFSERTAEAGLDGIHSYAFGATVADFDNDGEDDFYLTALRENMLFRNDGGRFVETGAQAGVAGPPEWSSAAVFFDADGDGLTDLYVGNYVIWSPEKDISCSLATGVRSYCTPDAYEGLPGRFYRNEGDGTFTDRTMEAGFGPPVPGKTLAAAPLDYDGDGDADLVVVNDTERDLLYRNSGDGTFEEVGIISGLAFDRYGRARAGMGVDIGVVDSTGRPTVFVANFAREMVGVYHYTGGGRFIDRALATNIGQASVSFLSFGLFVFDADLDGHLDLLTANGHISPEIEEVEESITCRQPVRIYRNEGDGTFRAVDGAFGGEDGVAEIVGRGAAYGDYDRDGDLDVLIVENGGRAHLWRNDVTGHSHLRVHLEGRASNRNGIGARVEAVVGRHRMIRAVKSGASYLSSSEMTVTFGLGDAPTVDSLTVVWSSGAIDTYTDIAANQELLAIEGEDLVPRHFEMHSTTASASLQ